MNQTRGVSGQHSIQADSYANHAQQQGIDAEEERLDDSRDTFEESEETTLGSSDDDSDPDASVLEDMERFEQSFKGITKRYKLINRIGEGITTSCRVITKANG